MLRNDNEPIFLEEPYELVLSESTIIGTSVYRITANDADGVSRLLFLNHCIAGQMFLLPSLLYAELLSIFD